MSADLSASDRLGLSRERLRRALRESAPQRRTAGRHDGFGSMAGWQDRLASIPGARIVIDATRQWWARHPLHAVMAVTAGAAQSAIRPLAQRHALGLMLGALLLGGLLVWSRPWRWLPKPALMVGLLSQLLGTVIAQAPIQSWLVAATSLAGEGPRSELSVTHGPGP